MFIWVQNMKSLQKNFSYTLFSNTFAFLISALISFILPKYIGVESYGFFQLYLFYTGYTGLFHYGIADGIFLRYGGQDYSNISKSVLSAQVRTCEYINLFVTILFCAVAIFFVQPDDKKIVLFLSASTILVTPVRIIFNNTLLCTNRISESAQATILQKLTYLILILLGIITKQKSSTYYIISSMLAELLALCILMIKCKDIVRSQPIGFRKNIEEIKINIIVGIKLTFATLVSSLIIGIIRMAIENQWDVETFGKVSLTISVSNLLMVLIRAIALVMFPMLCRIDTNRLASLYHKIRNILMIILLGMLVAYYPINAILTMWLPKYSDSLVYMALLFPMCVFESKMSMLIETYMKALRREKWILIVNLITVCCSGLLAFITAYCLHNLTLTVASIMLLIILRCVAAEYVVSKVLNISTQKDTLLEILLTIVFIWSSWFIGGGVGLSIYVISYISYLFIKRKDVRLASEIIKQIFEDNKGRNGTAQ